MSLDTYYQSPFSSRYGSTQMREIWSEQNKRLAWRKLWVALAEVQQSFGLVTEAQVNDLRQHQDQIDLHRSLEIEEEIQHDLMAEVRAYAEQCKVGGGIIHLGATSVDIKDNTIIHQVSQALDQVEIKLGAVLEELVDLIKQHADTVVIAYTHLQPAEPSTLGYRFSLYAQDLFEDLLELKKIKQTLKGKGFKGAVGTGASYIELVGSDRFDDFESALSERLGFTFYDVVSQTYPRKQDYRLLNALSGIGASIHKLAFDLRVLQVPSIGEWEEPRKDSQVGSSAMPFKRNPILAEKINSLARLLAQYPRVAWDNAAHSLLERTLDDSANRRVILPEAFLAVDELLVTTQRILSGIKLNVKGMKANLETYGPFAAVEIILMALVKAGADRQEMHERLRVLSMAAWRAIQEGQKNPLIPSIKDNEIIKQYLSETVIDQLVDYHKYTGNAEMKAIGFAEKIEAFLAGD